MLYCSRSFVLQLGDCIDGKNRPDSSDAALRDVRLELDRLGATLPLGVVSTLGNHELYNFPKERWAREVRVALLGLRLFCVYQPGVFCRYGTSVRCSHCMMVPGGCWFLNERDL